MRKPKVKVLPEATPCGASLGWFIVEYDEWGEFERLRRAESPRELYVHPVMQAVYSYEKFCRRPMGHAGHVPVRRPVVAAPDRVVHSHRFAPSGIPAGVDQTITVPHDCSVHGGTE